MEQSVKYREGKHNDKVVNKDWTPANSEEEAFIDEYFRLHNDGDHYNPDNYNERQSPGKKYYEKKQKHIK